jgi:hypothetical protein
VESTKLNTSLQIGLKQLLVICDNIKNYTGGSTPKEVRVKADAAEICEATDKWTSRRRVPPGRYSMVGIVNYWPVRYATAWGDRYHQILASHTGAHVTFTKRRFSQCTTNTLQYLFLFHGNNGYANAFQCHVMRALPVFSQSSSRLEPRHHYKLLALRTDPILSAQLWRPGFKGQDFLNKNNKPINIVTRRV